LSDQTNTLIVGASISGLACAATLQKHGIPHIIIEKQSQVTAPWRNHYERLHLHTPKSLSALPYKKFDKNIPRYPSRQQVVDYLEDYQQSFNISPLFNTEAISIKRKESYWITDTNNDTIKSKNVIIATGAFGKPKTISFNGMETFTDKILHSYDYNSGRDFKGQNVLVVGFGNSACEIAIDLYEQGAFPSMSVRSSVNILPRDIAGISILQLSLLMNLLPARVADKINAPLINLLVGDLKKLGLKKLPYGPLEQIEKYGAIPLLDIGTVGHIRKGNIKIYDDVDHIEGGTVYFTDGKSGHFDAIVAGIGYYRDYADIIKAGKERFDDLSLPIKKQKCFGKDGLYFCGFWIASTGQIREISMDAQKIAKHIHSKMKA